jgi:ATPase subunit of ABC transporter with duplicated ATPase domains
MITLNGITKKMGIRTLFEDITITFNKGNRYGLTGPNGAGKSTLLKIMMGQEEPTSGSVSLPKKVGFLKQNIEAFSDMLLVDVVIMGNARLWAAMQEQNALYEQDMSDEIGMRLGTLEEVIAEEDGYTAESDAESLLEGMDITSDMHRVKMHQIPLDRQFRVLLCQALFGNPEALLLDEPTNHLDMQAIGWLEKFLYNYQGTLIVVSHDKHFLNAVTTHIADIDYETLIIYPGNYDQMIVTKTSVRERAELENKSKEKKASQLKEFVAKFGAGTRASQVQSRLKELAQLAPSELKASNIERPYIRFYPPERPSGQLVYKIEKLCKSYDDKVVHKNLTFDVLKGDKIGIIGNNGQGKTTLLKMLAGHLAPDSGKIEKGHHLQVGYFPQNHAELVDKKSSETAFDWLKSKKPGTYDQDVRGILGKMLFGGDDAFKPLSALSGGETARLILGYLMLCNFNVLLLDEPNNHLDLESVAALAWAIEDFKGTVLVASHDRELLQGGCNKIINFDHKGMHLFEGSLSDYLAR